MKEGKEGLGLDEEGSVFMEFCVAEFCIAKVRSVREEVRHGGKI